MNKAMAFIIGAAFTLSSCDTYTGSGVIIGASIGSILGSAIGGISGGPYGSDIGEVVGMAGGAVVGGAVGAQADQRAQKRYEQRQQRQSQREAYDAGYQDGYEQGTRQNGMSNESSKNCDGSGFDVNNGGDDRIYDFNGPEYTGSYSAQQATTAAPDTIAASRLQPAIKLGKPVEVRNTRFVDDNQDRVINRGELCKVIFEVYNRTGQPLYDIQPTVREVSGNRHILISPSIHIEKILPGKGIRYTALVKADKRLKDGHAKICVSVLQGNGKTISSVSEFNIPTRR